MAVDLRRLDLLAPLALGLALPGCSPSVPPEPLACQAGAWQLPSGEIMALTPAQRGLRYRLLDGRTGELVGDASGELHALEGWRAVGEPVASARLEPCPAGRGRFALQDGPQGTIVRLPLRRFDATFESGALRLRGRLVLPATHAQGAHLLAVLVHGSEEYSAVDHYPLQYLLPAQGIAAFVYDKRGTGGSQGRYTQDFERLAADAAAALEAARALHSFARAGFVGGSQGGWVAPLAAAKAPVDYVVVMYGLAESALAEDRDEVLATLRSRGFGADVERKAREVTAATGRAMASRFREGLDELARVRRAYASEPWFEHVEGEFSGDLLRYPGWLLRIAGPFFDRGTSWSYEPLPVLAGLGAPQLWILAGADREAPHEPTLARLRALQRGGRPIDIALFPDTDHGILEFTEVAGERIFTRHAAGYFRLLADWVRDGGFAHPPYGRAILEPAGLTP